MQEHLHELFYSDGHNGLKAKILKTGETIGWELWKGYHQMGATLKTVSEQILYVPHIMIYRGF